MHRYVLATMVVMGLLIVRTATPVEGEGTKVSEGLSDTTTSDKVPPLERKSAPQVVHNLDLSDYAGNSVDAWLQSKGLKFEADAANRDMLNLSVSDGALTLEAKEALRGILRQNPLHLKRYSKIRIEWGVLKYPKGASYEKDVRNESIMVLVFFGEEKISSGHFISPDLPYFIGFYLCQDDRLNVPYKGKYYQEGGRYVCVGSPQPGETVVSEFNLVQAFHAYFDKSDLPPISGIALEVDTTSSADGGTAAAFVKRVEILE